MCSLLIKQRWQPKQSEAGVKDGSEGFYRVDVDVPADDWAKIAGFYDVWCLIQVTGNSFFIFLNFVTSG